MDSSALTTSELRLERSKPIAVNVIVGLNVVVWLAWKHGHHLQVGIPELLLDNFLVSLSSLEEGRWWTLLTSAFSHAMGLHLMVNMIVLKSFGQPLEQAWGSRRFVGFYLCAAVASSAAHASLSYFGWEDIPALGASGAIAGVLMCFAFLYPQRLLLFFMVVPVPAWLAVTAFVGLDIWGLIEQRSGGGLPIGHGAHLGGALFGLLWSLLDRSLGNDLEAYEEEALRLHESHRAPSAGPTVRRVRDRISTAIREAAAEAERQQGLERSADPRDDARDGESRRRRRRLRNPRR